MNTGMPAKSCVVNANPSFRLSLKFYRISLDPRAALPSFNEFERARPEVADGSPLADFATQ